MSQGWVERQEPGVDQHEPIDPLWVVRGQTAGHEPTHGMADDVSTLDADFVEQRGHLPWRLVEDEPRVSMARPEPWEVDGRHPERRGERRNVSLPPGAGARETMEQNEWRPIGAGLQCDDRTASGPIHGTAVIPRRA